MIKRILFYALAIIVLFTLQGTVFRSMNFFGAVPLCMLIFVVSVSMMQGEVHGAAVGAVAGVLFSPVHGLLFMLIGLATGMLSRDFFQARRTVVLMVVLMAEVAFDLLYYFFMFFIWGQTNIASAFTRIMLPEMAYTAVVAVPLYVLLEKINERITR